MYVVTRLSCTFWHTYWDFLRYIYKTVMCRQILDQDVSKLCLLQHVSICVPIPLLLTRIKVEVYVPNSLHQIYTFTIKKITRWISVVSLLFHWVSVLCKLLLQLCWNQWLTSPGMLSYSCLFMYLFFWTEMDTKSHRVNLSSSFPGRALPGESTW